MLKRAGLDKYCPVFREQEILYGDLRLLQDVDLERMNILIGPRRRLMEVLSRLPEEVDQDWILEHKAVYPAAAPAKRRGCGARLTGSYYGA